MYSGQDVVAALKACGVTHVVWIPDSHLGTWEPALSASTEVKLLRVCREGEAMGLAAGLLLGGQHPVVFVQCTGFFEAGDAFRNVVHDLKLPLFVVVGVRGYHAHQQGKTNDNCPIFAESIARAWQVPMLLIDPERDTIDDLASAYRQARADGKPCLVLLAE